MERRQIIENDMDFTQSFEAQHMILLIYTQR